MLILFSFKNLLAVLGRLRPLGGGNAACRAEKKEEDEIIIDICIYIYVYIYVYIYIHYL